MLLRPVLWPIKLHLRPSSMIHPLLLWIKLELHGLSFDLEKQIVTLLLSNCFMD